MLTHEHDPKRFMRVCGWELASIERVHDLVVVEVRKPTKAAGLTSLGYLCIARSVYIDIEGVELWGIMYELSTSR